MVVFHCGNPRNDHQITQMTIFQPKPVHRVITLCEAGRTKHAGLSQTELNQNTTALSGITGNKAKTAYKLQD